MKYLIIFLTLVSSAHAAGPGLSQSKAVHECIVQLAEDVGGTYDVDFEDNAISVAFQTGVECRGTVRKHKLTFNCGFDFGVGYKFQCKNNI